MIFRSAHDFRRWLAKEVHGKEIPRKPPVKARSPIRRGPVRDPRYLAWIRTLPCSACGVAGQSQAAHTGLDGGMGMKASDSSCIPLCADCHTMGPKAYHRLGKRAFEKHWGIRCATVAKRLWKEWSRTLPKGIPAK